MIKITFVRGAASIRRGTRQSNRRAQRKQRGRRILLPLETRQAFTSALLSLALYEGEAVVAELQSISLARFLCCLCFLLFQPPLICRGTHCASFSVCR